MTAVSFVKTPPWSRKIVWPGVIACRCRQFRLCARSVIGVRKKLSGQLIVQETGSAMRLARGNQNSKHPLAILHFQPLPVQRHPPQLSSQPKTTSPAAPDSFCEMCQTAPPDRAGDANLVKKDTFATENTLQLSVQEVVFV